MPIAVGLVALSAAVILTGGALNSRSLEIEAGVTAAAQRRVDANFRRIITVMTLGLAGYWIWKGLK
jgi:hypothetical protein